MSAGRARGHASLPDQLAFSRSHHTAQLWAPLLDDQAHLADTRGGHVIAAPYLDVLLTPVAWTVVGIAYYDATPEEAAYHVQARIAYRSNRYWEDVAIGIRITTATTAGASSRTTTVNPYGRVSPAPRDRTAELFAAAKIRTLAYPVMGGEELTDAGEVTADHPINSALAAGLRLITVEMYYGPGDMGIGSLPDVYLRSLLVTGYREGL